MSLKVGVLFLLFLCIASVATGQEDFSYLPPGNLLPGSGVGRAGDCTVYVTDLAFPLEMTPAYANSQVYGDNGPYCTDGNYSNPWQDNFCETRTEGAVLDYCPATGTQHHAGQDIRAAGCELDHYWVVSATDGIVTRTPALDPTKQYVTIVHDGFRYHYLHMDSVAVSWNQEVIAGVTRLGKVSNLSASGVPYTTPHLHFEIEMDEGGSVFENVPPYMSLVRAYRRDIGPITPGARIIASSNVDVYQSRGGSIIGSQPKGATGSVTGPSVVDNDAGNCWIWWPVRWDDNSIGWVQDNYISSTSDPSAPAPPSSLFQYSAQGEPIPIGTLTDSNAVQFRGQISSPLDKLVRLEIEVRTTSESFTGEAQAASDLMASGSEASVCISGFSNSTYHWQARTIDEDGLSSPWSSFGGGNSESFADFIVLANQCAICSASGMAFVEKERLVDSVCAPGFTAALTTTPVSGPAPLTAVDLAATVQGAGSEPITYTFYCDRADAGTDIAPGYASRVSSTFPTRTAVDICDYPEQGNYTAKVVAEQGMYVAEARTTVTVSQPVSQPPDVNTLTATGVTAGSATLNLSVNPHGESTLVWFRWGMSSSSLTEVTPSIDAGSGTTQVFRSATASALTCDRQYYYQAWADGSGVPVAGSVLSFRTDACGGNEITQDLIENGDFLDDAAFWSRSGSFFADDRFDNHHSSRGYAYLSQADGSPGNSIFGTIYQQVTIPVDATSAMLTYWVSITTWEPTGSPAEDFLNATLQDGSGNFLAGLEILSNQSFTGGYFQRQFNLINQVGRTVRIHYLGTTNASDPTVFRIDDVSLVVKIPTAGPPTATTSAADQIGQTTARLSMTVDPNGATTTVWFDLEANDSTPDDDTEHLSIGNGTGTEIVSYTAAGLDCGTLYYFRAHASNAEGSDSGSVRSFTTDACSGGSGSAPSVQTTSADGITKTSATLHAQVNPNGLQTEAWFAYGTTQEFGATAGRSGVGSGTTYTSFSAAISGLLCGRTYYFKVVAQNSEGTTEGDTLTFDTLACDPGEVLPGNFLQWAERQSCDETSPAILLRWTPSKDASPIYIVRRTDGAYVRTVDTSVEGFAHLVAEGLQYNHGYDFYIIAQNGAGTTPSNGVRVNIVNEECKVAGDPGEPPGPFILWWEPFTCQSGDLALEFHWSASAGATSYTLERFAVPGGVGRKVEGLTTTNFLDSVDLIPGVTHVWLLTAYNDVGSTRAQFAPQFDTPSGLCGEAGLPGPFTLATGTPMCVNGEPSIPISWSPSSGADNRYGYRVYGRAGSIGSGGVNTDVLGFTYHITAGVGADQVHEIVMVAHDPQDETKKRYSNSIFVRVPLDICGPANLTPEAYTQPASGVTSDSAVLRSQVRPNGSSTYVSFEWGETTSYGNETSEVDVGDTTLYLERPSRQVAGLDCETEYHFRVVAINSTGQTLGTDESFSTDACPPCGPLELLLSNMSVDAQETHEACSVIRVGPSVSVEATGQLRLVAPRVVFGDGFAVRSGGKLEVFPSPGAVPQPPIEEDFEDGNLDEWEFQIFGSNQHTASWGLVQDGSTVLELAGGTTSGGGDVIAYRTDFSEADYSISARLKVHEVRNGGHHSGLAARATNGLNFYELSVNRAQDLMRLLGWENGQARDIASAPLPPSLLDEWIEIEFEVIGDHLRGYINGTMYIEATDGAHLSGRVGVVNSGSVTRFDDLAVEP